MSNDPESKSGCLFALLALFGIRPGGGEAEAGTRGTPLPYKLRDDFLSPAELSFFQVMRQVLGEQGVVLAKVNVADLLFVPRGEGSQSFRNRIDRKHVDFVICDPRTAHPLAAVELDDSSHNRADRQERDAFLEAAFRAAGLPLLRVPAQRSYAVEDIAALVRPLLGKAAPPAVAAPRNAGEAGTPNCPKCGVPLVRRQATRGAQAGKAFFGCPNYPQCRHTVPVEG